MNLQDLLDELRERDGVNRARVRVSVEPEIKKELAGEDDRYQPIRERVIDEDELEELSEETDWWYSGVVDSMSDYVDVDRVSKHYTVDL